MELHERLARVSDERTFLEFVEALRADRAASDQEPNVSRGWQNDTIASFLESACAWASDSDFGEGEGLSDSSPWKKFAVFLYAGKIYE